MEKHHWRPEPNNLGVETWRQYADSSLESFLEVHFHVQMEVTDLHVWLYNKTAGSLKAYEIYTSYFAHIVELQRSIG